MRAIRRAEIYIGNLTKKKTTTISLELIFILKKLEENTVMINYLKFFVQLIFNLIYRIYKY